MWLHLLTPWVFEFAQANTTLQVQFPLHFPRLIQHLPNEERRQIWDPRVTLLIVMGSVGQEFEQCLSLLSISVIETVTIFEEESGVISA